MPVTLPSATRRVALFALLASMSGCADLSPRQQRAVEIGTAVGVTLIAGAVQASQGHHAPPQSIAMPIAQTIRQAP